MHDGKNKTIYELIRARAERAPEAVAIRAPGCCALTYGGLLEQVNGVVKFLQGGGISPGDRVGIVLPNGPEMAVALLGIAGAAVCAPLNPASSAGEFEFYLSDLNLTALIVQARMSSAASAIAEKHGIPVIELLPRLERAAGIFTLRGDGRSVILRHRFPQADDVALILHTSGTTSRAKLVPLSHDNLLASASSIAASLHLTEADSCLNVMPLFHIHGLVGALLSSVLAGASVICTPGFDSERFFAWLDMLAPTWYTAVPTMHHAVVARARSNPELVKGHSLRFVRSSSSAMPLRVMQELEERFHVPVIEAYGMTEAAHQMSSNPLPPGQRKLGSVGMAAGPEVSIMDELGNLLSPGRVGEIVIRGANVTSGYLNSPQSNDESSEHGWFRTGDQGYLDTDEYLFITGRLKEIINRGGEKIAPREVEDIILHHRAIAEAIAFAVPHETLGQDIAAAVVPRENANVTESEIQRFVASQLSAFKIPQRVLFVDEIPKSASGKPERLNLAKKFRALLSQPRIRESLAPQTETEKTLAAIWSKVLAVGHFDIQDNFFNLGGDSLRAMQVISRIRESMQIELSIRSFFETPTVAGLAQRIERSLPSDNSFRSPPARLSTRNEPIPLSFAQQRLWFLDQLEPGIPVYNRPVVFRLTGQLDINVLDRCLNEIVRRHEILRTSFPVIDGEPSQVISQKLTIPLPVVDLTGFADDEREAEALRRATWESHQPFDLAAGPLLKARLFRLDAEKHLLLLLTDHMVSDGWSDHLLIGEITKLYHAFMNGRPSPLTDLPIQYSDYALWQQSEVEERRHTEDASYWREQLKDAPLLLNLPTDRVPPSVQTYTGARQVFSLPVGLAEELRDLSRRENVTLFMTLFAAFTVLLYRYTGQGDLLVGVPVLGRDRVETEELIGVFVNTLVLRTKLSGDLRFFDLLRRVREAALAAYAHQELPFEKLVNLMRLDRDPSGTPLFQVMFQLRNFPGCDAKLSGLGVEPISLDIGLAKFDLSLEIAEKANGLECLFEYNRELFDAATLLRMQAHFRNLLENIVAHNDRRISDLPFLTEQERHQLLVEWNDTKTDRVSSRCIHQEFEIHAEQTPNALAVVFNERRLSYRELNRRSNQLAHYLRKLGVGPESLVGVCLEPSLELAVALLGVLKAGGAYVPLDPTYPKERLGFMLQDAQMTVLMSQPHLLGILPNHNVRVVCLDLDCHEISLESEENPDNGASVENLAYVIFTSGSTGRPKGVAVPHCAVVNVLTHMQEQLRLNAQDTLLFIASLSFDISVLEFFLPLMSGASVVLVSREVAADGSQLSKMLSNSHATILHGTPATWRLLLQAGCRGRAPLKMLCGGETLQYELAGQLCAGGSTVWNLYGPTETTIYSSSGVYLRDSHRRSVSIGKPIANTQIYLLDRQLRPVPIGVAGELYVGGAGVARGYLNRPDLTAEKFIPDPFRSAPGARLYRTGDLARYLPDGSIECLGRIDHQVKIRGYRIECGEVESALRQYPAVREAVVVAQEASSVASIGPAKRLVAYVVAAQNLVPSAHELRAFLKHTLPEYMLPSAFVLLEAFPLMPNGKLDRAALPPPDQSRPELKKLVPPRTAVENALAQIWKDVLKLDEIGIHDNFFEMGGHSLRATLVLSQVRHVFQVELPMRTLFDRQTVCELAKAITDLQGDALIAEITNTLLEIESLSDEEAQALAVKEKLAGGNRIVD
jgi:amino acid adenylation domain-containing protein